MVAPSYEIQSQNAQVSDEISKRMGAKGVELEYHQGKQ
jgi:hypothetical protein